MDRRLGLAAATSAVVGQVIAVGIFLTPASMARTLGSPFWLLAAWLLMGGMALSGALAYGELAARFPEAGGGYVYLREVYGRRLAFLYGWKCLLVMDPGITAALAAGIASYAAYLVPMGPATMKIVAVGAILVAAALNIVGSQTGARSLAAMTVLKLGGSVLRNPESWIPVAFDTTLSATIAPLAANRMGATSTPSAYTSKP